MGLAGIVAKQLAELPGVVGGKGGRGKDSRAQRAGLGTGMVGMAELLPGGTWSCVRLCYGPRHNYVLAQTLLLDLGKKEWLRI